MLPRKHHTDVKQNVKRFMHDTSFQCAYAACSRWLAASVELLALAAAFIALAHFVIKTAQQTVTTEPVAILIVQR
jgi:hypothetical protein